MMTWTTSDSGTARRRQIDRGFTLIATLLIVALVAVAVVGFLSVVSSRTATTNINARRAEAQSNALVGVRMAVAQLQEFAGPDQRVTATAEILDRDPATDDIEGVAHPHWTGVWSSTWDDTGAEYIRRNDRRGGLLDRRTDQPMTDPRDKESKVLTWLVSGNEQANAQRQQGTQLPVRPGEAFPEDGDDTVEVVGSGSALQKDAVRVQKVPIPTSTPRRDPQEKGRRPGVGGHYAFWVGDENVKAKVNVRNPHIDQKIDPEHAGDGVYSSLMTAPSARFDPVWQNADIDESLKSAVIGTGDFFALQPDIASRELIQREAFHSTTAYSLGVLSDVRLGGLKRDLTAYFLDKDGVVPPIKMGSKVVSPGLADTDNMVGPQNQDASVAQGISWGRTYHRAAGPRFGRLRQWARLGKDISVRRNESEQRSPKQATVGDKDVDFSYDYTVRYMPDLEDQEDTALKPLLVEGSVYFGMSSSLVNGVPKLRLHIYPRVVMWNPYNVILKPQGYALFLAVLGQQNFTLSLADGSSRQLKYILPNTKEPLVVDDVDPTEGNLCFSIDPIEFGPGECLVFSADHSGAQSYNLGNIGANRLSAKRFPDVQNFYLDECFHGNTTFTAQQIPQTFRYEESFAEDHRMILKETPPKGGIRGQFSVDDMKRFDTVQIVSCSYSAGGRSYAHGKWNNSLAIPISERQTPAPHYKTRDGYRMRWFNETSANMRFWTPERHMETAPVANYNMQGTISLRTPWENLALRKGAGFELFSLYTRDVWDNDAEWSNLSPIPLQGGKWGGNPFGAVQEWAHEKYILFDVPRTETGIQSLAQLQHAKLSEYMWHPSYAIGNSFADPRSPRDQTSPRYDNEFGGWNTKEYLNDDYHGYLFRSMMGEQTENILVYDLSYEVNYSIWDAYFLSTGTAKEKQAFAFDPHSYPLPNARMKMNDFISRENAEAELVDFHRAANRLLVDGAFNVHSTSVDAWKAMLSANRDIRYGGVTHKEATPFPRQLLTEGKPFDPGGDASDSENTWSGYRVLTDEEIDRLAREIVREIKVRAPFVSMADFVNRRLAVDETGQMGPLQAAINRAGLNASFEDFPIDLEPIDSKPELHKMFQENKAPHKAAGAPGYLLQSDLLTPLGPLLTARSDTFLVRAYGDSVAKNGKVVARAWCEAVVQRTPEPLNPDAIGLNPSTDSAPREKDFGRRFKILSTRWLQPDEI
ncbi:MAG: hypothetical protein KDN22_04590 [Verrucomicrobiae bacterium]|nr:hypothetical protein [Verrucomicrobiae bacterium]